MERNLTEGSILNNIIIFSLPYLLSYFLQTLYGMADLFIIGQFEGVAATTAVSIGSQVMHMITVMIVGLAMGTTVSIGQAVGAGDQKRVSAGIGNTIILFMSLSVVLALVLLLCIEPIVSVMSTPTEAVDGTISYLFICFIGIPFITAYNIIASIFRGLGDSKTPMYFIAVACVVNIALDYLFMGAFRMGPAGAALGTTLSQGFSVVIALITVKKRKTGTQLKKNDFRPRSSIMGKLLKIGIPVALQDGCVQIGFIIITIIANSRGLTDAAAVGIVEKIISFLFLVPSSMLATVSALGAQNIGAGKGRRAVMVLKYGILISFCYGLILAIAVQFVAEPTVGFFTNDAGVILAGAQYLHGYIWDAIFVAFHFCFSGYFCACGRSELSFLHNICSIVLVRVPGAYLMSKLFPSTLFPMGLSTVAGSFLSIIICGIAFSLMLKKQRQNPVGGI